MKIHIAIPSSAELDSLADRLARAIDEAVWEVAQRYPDQLTRLLARGLRPDGGAQPPLAASTIESKRRKGQPLTPLVADGLLTDPGLWVRRRLARGAEVLPPVQRQDVVEILEARGFEIQGLPDETIQDLERTIQLRLDGVR